MNISSNGGAFRALDAAQAQQNKSLRQVASGKGIQSAADDAAGLSISTRFNAQIRSNQVAMRNTMDGVSRVQVEDGALSSVTEDLQRIRELTVQKQGGILNDRDKAAIDREIGQRVSSIQQVFKDTQFNGQPVFEKGEQVFQTGANPGQTITMETEDLAESVGAVSGDLADLDNALELVSKRRAELGATANRFEAAFERTQVENEALTQANSRIEDADIAESISNKIRSDIQQKAAISVQSQSNMNNKAVLQLLEG